MKYIPPEQVAFQTYTKQYSRMSSNQSGSMRREERRGNQTQLYHPPPNNFTRNHPLDLNLTNVKESESRLKLKKHSKAHLSRLRNQKQSISQLQNKTNGFDGPYKALPTISKHPKAKNNIHELRILYFMENYESTKIPNTSKEKTTKRSSRNRKPRRHHFTFDENEHERTSSPEPTPDDYLGQLPHEVVPEIRLKKRHKRSKHRRDKKEEDIKLPTISLSTQQQFHTDH